MKQPHCNDVHSLQTNLCSSNITDFELELTKYYSASQLHQNLKENVATQLR